MIKRKLNAPLEAGMRVSVRMGQRRRGKGVLPKVVRDEGGSAMLKNFLITYMSKLPLRTTTNSRTHDPTWDMSLN